MLTFILTLRGNYLGIAAGSGITPLLSIIKTTLAVQKKSHFTLLYGNRSRSSIIFREQLEALKNRYMDRFSLVHVFSREQVDSPPNQGRIDAEKCRQFDQKLVDFQSMDHIFLCGPLPMIESISGWLKETGFPANHIHFELFNAPLVTQHPEKINGRTRTGQPTKPGYFHTRWRKQDIFHGLVW
jgi:ring-1,2-phenylacetyl-CoA epoxidase subunit PaaE